MNIGNERQRNFNSCICNAKKKKVFYEPKVFPFFVLSGITRYIQTLWVASASEHFQRYFFLLLLCLCFEAEKLFFWRTNRDELNLKKKKKKKKDEGRRTFHQLLQALPIHNTSRFTQCPSSHFFIISPYCPKTKRNNRNNSKNSHRLMTNDIEFFSG